MNKQQGFTLVELMISSVIGLIIMAGMMNLFITVNQNVALSDALSQNQETGRFAMEYLTKNVRKAGYTDDPKISMSSILISSSNIPCTTTSDPEACSENNPDSARGDRLAIPFHVSDGETVRSCTGTVLGDDATDPARAANVFWVSNDPDTDRELLCRVYDMEANDWLLNSIGEAEAAVSIITNVEAFEFQVGVASRRGSRDAAKYVSVDNIPVNADNLTDIELIRSIRISLLTTSQNTTDENKSSTNQTTRTYSLMDAPYLVITDGNLRTLFNNTIELPNKIENVDSSDI